MRRNEALEPHVQARCSTACSRSWGSPKIWTTGGYGSTLAHTHHGQMRLWHVYRQQLPDLSEHAVHVFKVEGFRIEVVASPFNHARVVGVVGRR